MKKRKFKLSLNKKVISNLNMSNAKGVRPGPVPNTDYCPTTEDSYYTYCVMCTPTYTQEGNFTCGDGGTGGGGTGGGTIPPNTL